MWVVLKHVLWGHRNHVTSTMHTQADRADERRVYNVTRWWFVYTEPEYITLWAEERARPRTMAVVAPLHADLVEMVGFWQQPGSSVSI